jgi:DNA topoisomerase I
LLDNIAEGKQEWVPVIRDFYEPFAKRIAEKTEELVKSELTETETDEVCEKCKKPMVIKVGRFGKFLACTGYPECRNTKNIAADGSIEPPETTDEKCPTCEADMVVKHGRYGAFLSCSKYPDCKTNKPILKSTGVKCEKCGKGELVERRSKRGRKFWGCDTYPDCDFLVWKYPGKQEGEETAEKEEAE